MLITADFISRFHCWGSVKMLFRQFHVRNCICTKFSTSINTGGIYNPARL